jgi:dolichyl-diphosphooligosaccharide--protein glycosyltransferase
VYFAGVMVRLMLTLTPVVCILSGVAFSGLLELFLREDDTPRNEDSDEEDQSPPNNRRLYDKVNPSRLLFSRLD